VLDPPTTPSTLIKVISLATDYERRAEFRMRAISTGLDWSFFDACTELSADLQYCTDDALIHRGRVLTLGELGCYASHYQLWQEFLATDQRQLLVLEDDTIVDWRFVQQLIGTDLSTAGIDYLRLFSKALGKPTVIAPFMDRYLIENVAYSSGTQAYLVTRAGAAFLLAHLRRVRAPIDDSLDHGWRGSLPTLAVYPAPVIEIAGESRIGPRIERAPVPAHLRRRREWFRTLDRARRVLYRLQRYFARLRARSASIDSNSPSGPIALLNASRMLSRENGLVSSSSRFKNAVSLSVGTPVTKSLANNRRD
jgi:glycosyl transferase family 25